MASIQLYNENFGEGLQTFTLAEANLLEATKDTHYTENYLDKATNPMTSEDVWIVNLSIPLAGMDYVSPEKSYQPLPDYPLYKHTNEQTLHTYWYPLYIDPAGAGTALTEQPSDWAVHWRDKYNTLPQAQWGVNNSNHLYYSDPTRGSSYGDPPTFASGTYYETNMARHIYWTMDGNYFPFEWGWFKGGTFSDISTMYYGLRFSWAQYGAYNANWNQSWQAVNNPRFAGVNGTLVYGNAGGGENYLTALHNYGSYSDLTGDITPHLYFNFIGFKYKFTDNTGEVPVEKEEEFIGLIAWEESDDNIPQWARIMALSKNFFGVRKKPANGGPISGIQGGNGTFSAPSDNRGDRNGATVGGIVSEWNGNTSIFSPGYNNYMLGSPDVGAFREMVENLWDPDIIEGFKNLMMSPINAIVCSHQIPAVFAPASTGSDLIKAAGITLSETAVPTFGSWITHWHGGSIDLSEYTGSFADYSNTSVYIHLPYIGTQLIDVAACMNGWLAVDYAVDVISGECTAFITCCDRFGNTQIRYEFKGDCSRSIDLHQKVPIDTQVAGSVIPVVVSGMVGGAAGAVFGKIGTASLMHNIAANIVNKDPAAVSYDEAYGLVEVSAPEIAAYGAQQSVAGSSGSILSSAGKAALSGQAMGSSNASGGNVSSPIDTQIWVLITRPQWSNPELFSRELAYPSDISGKVGDFSGYLSTRTAELNSIDCTDIERGEILQRLGAGVLLS